jgi:tetratricopeptide (TPR) repeat protein
MGVKALVSLALAVVVLNIARPGALHAQSPAPPASEAALKIIVTHHGSGASLKPGEVVIAHYVGTLDDGSKFDSSRDRNKPFAFTLGRGQVIKGWDQAFATLRVGDQARLIIPPSLAYGDKVKKRIPPNSTLTFDVEVLDSKPASLADALAEVIDKDGVEPAMALAAKLQSAGFPKLYVDEEQLNELGYKYLKLQKVPQSVAVLGLAAKLFPNSSNAHDSFGEVLAISGQKEAAIRQYERAIALDPKAENAKSKLTQLRNQQ